MKLIRQLNGYERGVVMNKLAGLTIQNGKAQEALVKSDEIVLNMALNIIEEHIREIRAIFYE
jgi:hypothetical protein